MNRQIEQVDGYVKGLLKYAKRLHPEIEIDLENPTREQRLEAAMAMRGDANGFTSMEIMLGKRVSSDSNEAMTFGFLILANDITEESNARTFFDGFSHSHYPE